MHERYENPTIKRIFSAEHKLELWQGTELAVTGALVDIGQVPQPDFERMEALLKAKPINIKWWKKRDAVVGHDLNAFLEERLRHLPKELQPHFHCGMTSYDTEEPAFVRMLALASEEVAQAAKRLVDVLRLQALRYRYTLMVGRTHGQQAELQTHGKRCLTWLQAIAVDLENLERTRENLCFSKISGAVGNWGDLHPEVERAALARLGLKPFYGSTQILPRELHIPLAQALAQLVGSLNKVALDIRLNARTPRPIYQEPFGKKQKGSSAMPHKKNTIVTEQIEGMARMADSYALGIARNVTTWEERAIEQSCVERVFWPDLFHVVLNSLTKMTKVLDGLVIKRENMLLDILDCRGCYATAGAKEVLKQLIVSHGCSAEDAYRIIQLAAFNLFAAADSTGSPPQSFEAAVTELERMTLDWKPQPFDVPLQSWIAESRLVVSTELDASITKIRGWNRILKRVFAGQVAREEWAAAFEPAHVLRHEAHLYSSILSM